MPRAPMEFAKGARAGSASGGGGGSVCRTFFHEQHGGEYAREGQDDG